MCRFPGATFVFPHNIYIILSNVITALNWFPGCEKPICRPKTHLYVIRKQSYDTFPCSGGHFGFCPLAAIAQSEI